MSDFARLLAEHEGCTTDAAYDEELLFAATVMHDLGLGERARGLARFEVEEGADLAAAVLREHAVAEADVDRVWEAIALQSSIGIADDGLRTQVLDAYPRPTEGPYMTDAIVAHGNRSPAAAPPGSLAAYLLLQQRQRRKPSR